MSLFLVGIFLQEGFPVETSRYDNLTMAEIEAVVGVKRQTLEKLYPLEDWRIGPGSYSLPRLLRLMRLEFKRQLHMVREGRDAALAHRARWEANLAAEQQQLDEKKRDLQREQFALGQLRVDIMAQPDERLREVKRQLHGLQDEHKQLRSEHDKLQLYYKDCRDDYRKVATELHELKRGEK